MLETFSTYPHSDVYIPMSKVLVIEDEKDCSDMLSRVLSRDGHDVVTAANGWEGLIAVDKHSIDLIVLDLMMPGMDGYTFLQILREDRHHTHTPVILLTAMENSISDQRAQRLGVTEHFLKGCDEISELAAAVKRHLPPSGARGIGEGHHPLP
jgi:CheY-like chemotaxis protein